MEILTVIPARSGSKGIKNKNIKKLNGKPLIEYSIKASLNSKYISRTIVTTDSSEYADISKRCGAEVPFLRSKELAKDDLHAVYPVIDCIKQLKISEDYFPDCVVMLLPTSPLRKTFHIDRALEEFFEFDHGSIISVTKAQTFPHYLRKISNDELIPYEKAKSGPNFQRQELDDFYELNGSIYITTTKELLEHKTFHMDTIHPFIMDEKYSIDINTELDFEIAECLIKKEMNSIE